MNGHVTAKQMGLL